MPPAPPPGRKNTATQHLCAAAYLDRKFRDRVIDEVYDRPDRAIAPNPGTDAVPVLRHVLRSRTIDVLQQALLAGLLALLVFAPVVNKISLAVVLLLWAFVGQVGLAVASRRASSARRRGVRLMVGLGVFAAAAGGLYVLAPVYHFGPQTTFILDIEQYRWAGTDHLDVYACLGFRDSEFFGDDFIECVGYSTQKGFPPGTVGALIWPLVLGVLTAAFGVLKARSLFSIPAEPEPMRPANRRIHFIGESQHSPVVAYNATRGPFVGSGTRIENWQFAMALRPAEPRQGGDAAPSIDPVSLNGHIRNRLKQLGSDSSITRRLPSLVLSDHLYVSGRDMADLVRYPYELARSGYPFQTVDQVQHDPTTPVRHYLRCEVASWDGELVTSVFVHCALQGESLYVEFTGSLLPPTREEYQVYGYGASSRRTMMLRGSLRGAASMPVLLARSPIDSLRNLYRALRRIFLKPGRYARDSGAVTGIRELGSGALEQNFFQSRDSVKYVRILERQILDALTEYLRENNVDTSELEERVTAIVNNGVVNFGELNTGAAGQGASANVGSIGRGGRGTVKGA